MDDTLAELRFLWEKSNNLKKYDLPTTSSVRKKLVVEKENKTDKCSEVFVHLNPGKVNCKENNKPHIADVLKSRCNSSFHKKTDSAQETKDSNSNAEQKAENVTKNTVKVKVEPAENYYSNYRASSGVKFENKEPSLVPEDAHVFRAQHSVDTKVSNVAPSCRFNFEEDFVSGCSNSMDKENSVNGESLLRNSKMTGETRVSDDDLMKNDVEVKTDPLVSDEAETKPKGDGKEEDNVDMVCFEELRLLWEKANKLKKYGIYSDEYVKDGQQSSSSARQNVEVEKKNKRTCKTSIDQNHLNPGKVKCKEKNKSRNAGVGKPRRNSTSRKKTPLKSAQESKDSENNAPENHDIVPPVSKGSSFGDTLKRNEVESDTKEDDPQKDKDGPLHKEDDGDLDTFQDCLINDREKLKETDEYKRAVEEEWASRQQALQLQAGEAQKMRKALKRKKAESKRLLDIEKRQKQRVEEVRKTQKKDEENNDMKVKLRAEVRMKLQLLEKSSCDMASLLRGLGVHVGGGLKPMPHEIRAAYKKALLSFHPDRAPASDIRKLVEAEEKFKLISRMKDKFLSSS